MKCRLYGMNVLINMCYNKKNMQAFFRNSLEIPAFVFKILPIEYKSEREDDDMVKGAAE